MDGGAAAPGGPGLDWTVTAAEDQVSTDLGGEVVILNLADENYYGLDEVGALVWSMLDAPSTVAALRDAVTAAYEVDPATAERDLVSLLRDMAARGLVILRPPGAAAG